MAIVDCLIYDRPAGSPGMTCYEIMRSDDGWTIHIPDHVVELLDLTDGQRVTVRAVVPPERGNSHAIAEMRGNLPDFLFHHMNWQGS